MKHIISKTNIHNPFLLSLTSGSIIVFVLLGFIRGNIGFILLLFASYCGVLVYRNAIYSGYASPVIRKERIQSQR